MSKYLEFKKNEIGITTIISKRQKAPLGEIVFHHGWKQYVFEPISNTIFNDTCLMDITEQIKHLNKNRGK